VVTYHGVVADGYRSADSFLDNTLVTVEQFRSQLKLLKEHYELITPEQFRVCVGESRDLPERAVLLTCDDGLLNNLSVMLPLLQEEGLQCLFFVTGQSANDAPPMLWYVELYLMLMNARSNRRKQEIGGVSMPEIAGAPLERRSEWMPLVNRLSRLDVKEREQLLRQAAVGWGLNHDWQQRYFQGPAQRQRFQLLSSVDLKALAAAGMTIGAHTLNHPVLSAQSPECARAEVSDCKRKLEDCIKQPVWALAYPFGSEDAVGAREYQFAEDSGYECAFMNAPGDLRASHKFSKPRVHVTAEMSLEVFEAHVSGFHENLRARFRGFQQHPNGSGGIP
jgi:peptidoglycan/xylan/chitin deacetylase (PgdA/CDA1 family)